MIGHGDHFGVGISIVNNWKPLDLLLILSSFLSSLPPSPSSSHCIQYLNSRKWRHFRPSSYQDIFGLNDFCASIFFVYCHLIIFYKQFVNDADGYKVRQGRHTSPVFQWCLFHIVQIPTWTKIINWPFMEHWRVDFGPHPRRLKMNPTSNQRETWTKHNSGQMPCKQAFPMKWYTIELLGLGD